MRLLMGLLSFSAVVVVGGVFETVMIGSRLIAACLRLNCSLSSRNCCCCCCSTRFGRLLMESFAVVFAVGCLFPMGFLSVGIRLSFCLLETRIRYLD